MYSIIVGIAAFCLHKTRRFFVVRNGMWNVAVGMLVLNGVHTLSCLQW